MTCNRRLARSKVTALVATAAADQSVTVADLTSRARPDALARVRFAIVWAARTGLRASWPAVGGALGGRNHTTMLHAWRRAEGLRSADPAFRDLTDRLLASLFTRND